MNKQYNNSKGKQGSGNNNVSGNNNNVRNNVSSNINSNNNISNNLFDSFIRIIIVNNFIEFY